MAELFDQQPADGLMMETPIGVYELIKQWDEPEDENLPLQFGGWFLSPRYQRVEQDGMQVPDPNAPEDIKLEGVGSEEYGRALVNLLATYAKDLEKHESDAGRLMDEALWTLRMLVRASDSEEEARKVWEECEYVFGFTGLQEPIED